MITKITIKEREIIEHANKPNEIRFVEKEYNERTCNDLDNLALANISDWDIQDYAKDNLNLIEEDDCEDCDISCEDTKRLIFELEERGYKVVKCETINDTLRFEKVKEIMGL